MAKWFGAHYNQEVRFGSAVECKKGPQGMIDVLTNSTTEAGWFSMLNLINFVKSKMHTYKTF